MQYTPPRGPVQVRCREQAQKLSDEDARGLDALLDDANVAGRYVARLVARFERDWRARWFVVRLAVATARPAR